MALMAITQPWPVDTDTVSAGVLGRVAGYVRLLHYRRHIRPSCYGDDSDTRGNPKLSVFPSEMKRFNSFPDFCQCAFSTAFVTAKEGDGKLIPS